MLPPKFPSVERFEDERPGYPPSPSVWTHPDVHVSRTFIGRVVGRVAVEDAYQVPLFVPAEETIDVVRGIDPAANVIDASGPSAGVLVYLRFPRHDGVFGHVRFELHVGGVELFAKNRHPVTRVWRGLPCIAMA